MSDGGVMRSAGCIILALDTKRFLYQMRPPNWKGHRNFGFWGGKGEGGEPFFDIMKREIEEELGMMPEFRDVIPLHRLDDQKRRRGGNVFEIEYMTFLGAVDREFIPHRLNREESEGYAWYDWEVVPYPVLRGPRDMLNNPKILSKIRQFARNMDSQRESAVEDGDGSAGEAGEVS